MGNVSVSPGKTFSSTERVNPAGLNLLLGGAQFGINGLPDDVTQYSAALSGSTAQNAEVQAAIDAANDGSPPDNHTVGNSKVMMIPDNSQLLLANTAAWPKLKSGTRLEGFNKEGSRIKYRFETLTVSSLTQSSGTATLTAASGDLSTFGLSAGEWLRLNGGDYVDVTLANINVATDTLTVTSNPFVEGQAIRFLFRSAVIAGLVHEAIVYAKNVTGTTFQVSATSGGSAMVLTKAFGNRCRFETAWMGYVQITAVTSTTLTFNVDTNCPASFDGTVECVPRPFGITNWVPDETNEFAQELFSGTVVSATSTTVTLNSSASSVDDAYNGFTYRDLANGQTRAITDYVGSTRTLTIGTAFTTTPSGGDGLEIESRRQNNFGLKNLTLLLDPSITCPEGVWMMRWRNCEEPEVQDVRCVMHHFGQGNPLGDGNANKASAMLCELVIGLHVRNLTTDLGLYGIKGTTARGAASGISKGEINGCNFYGHDHFAIELDNSFQVSGVGNTIHSPASGQDGAGGIHYGSGANGNEINGLIRYPLNVGVLSIGSHNLGRMLIHHGGLTENTFHQKRNFIIGGDYNRFEVVSYGAKIGATFLPSTQDNEIEGTFRDVQTPAEGLTPANRLRMQNPVRPARKAWTFPGAAGTDTIDGTSSAALGTGAWLIYFETGINEDAATTAQGMLYFGDQNPPDLSTGGPHLAVRKDGNNDLVLWFADDASNYSGIKVDDWDWGVPHDVAWGHDGSGEFLLWVDGLETNFIEISDGSPSSVLGTTSIPGTNLTLGRSNTGTNYLNGWISAAAVFSAVPSADELQWLRRSPWWSEEMLTALSCLVAYRADASFGGNIPDLTGNGNDATLNGNVGYTDNYDSVIGRLVTEPIEIDNSDLPASASGSYTQSEIDGIIDYCEKVNSVLRTLRLHLNALTDSLEAAGVYRTKGTNLVTDGSFSSGLTSWTGPIGTETATASNGLVSLDRNSEATLQNIITSASFNVTAGMRYRAQVTVLSVSDQLIANYVEGSYTITAAGVYEFEWTAASTTTRTIGFRIGGSTTGTAEIALVHVEAIG